MSLNAPQMNLRQLQKLAENPHYRMTEQQQNRLNELMAQQRVDATTITTQEIRPTDSNVNITIVKKKGAESHDRSVNRSPLSTEGVPSEVQGE